MVFRWLCLTILLFLVITVSGQSFVRVKGQQFSIQNKPYYYIGTNYWFGSLLPLIKEKHRGIVRLRKELDFMVSRGVKNLRIVAAAEGSGPINGNPRITPAFQPKKGVFNDSVLLGLDVLLHEMRKRNMKAVIYLSNNWEWSGGFLQYLNWNGLIADSVLRRPLNWDEMRNYISAFYTCSDCKKNYLTQVDRIISRTNKISGLKYIDDPAIMAWELANEPRPMRPSAINAYKEWISSTAYHIKTKDKKHLVTIGTEGYIGTEQSPEIYEQIHAGKNIDYLTIHIWPKNWGWFNQTTMTKDFPEVLKKTQEYIDEHIRIATTLKKPLVIEEFGFPRDHFLFNPGTATLLRDQYYTYILTQWTQSVQQQQALAGVNFWAFNGIARPVPGQLFWKEGDDYLGDPPMEEQSINGVYITDTSTWNIIQQYTRYCKY